MRGTGRGRVCLQRLEVAHAASGVCPPSRRYAAQERDLNLRRYRSSLFACRTRWPFGRRFGQCHADPLALHPRVSRDHVDLAYRRLAVDLWRDETDDASHRVVGHPDLLVWVSEDRSHLRGLTGTPIAPQPLKQLSRSAWRSDSNTGSHARNETAMTASSSDSRTHGAQS